MAADLTEKPSRHTPATPPALYRMWRDRRIGVAVTLGIAALTGVLVALTMPRGPATAPQALVLMVAGLAIGLVAGLAVRSRWAMLLAPVAHIAAIEVTRLDVVGPTVDAIRFDSIFGILALILGRGFHGLVSLAPMMLGAGLGAALGRRMGQAGRPVPPPSGRLRTAIRWMPATLLSIGLVALAVAIALPGSTPPILGTDGKPLPGSIAELTTVRLGGHDQAVLIRGHSVDNPVLLYLSGGPGQSDIGWSRVFFSELAQDFTVVGWDQRGAGKSYVALDPASTLTLERAISDTIELTDYLRERFHQEKIYLLGESWGTTLGVLAVQRRPELYYAFIGSGQMVSQRETDRRLYQDLLDLAARTGDEQLAARMHAFGEPPYRDFLAYAFVMGYYDRLSRPYTPPQAYLERGKASGMGPLRNLASEYNLVEKVNVVRGLLDMASVLYPQLQEIDFRRDVPRLEVPVYILDGQAELTARRDLALEWFNALQAPQKRLFTFEDAGHAVAFEEFQSFHRIMTETILPETYPGRSQ